MTHISRWLKAALQGFSVLLITLVAFLGFKQTALAVAERYEAGTKSLSIPGITESVAGKNIEELKEERREWQNRASSSHDNKTDEPDSLGEVLNETLNFEEIKEGYHPEMGSDEAVPKTFSYSH